MLIYKKSDLHKMKAKILRSFRSILCHFLEVITV